MGYINRHKVFFAVQRQVYPANFQEKTITPNTFQREITPDVGYDALSKVKLHGILVDAHSEIESEVDSDVKYIKNVPAGALQYAGLNKVGGMSYKFVQLVKNGNFADSSVWQGSGTSYAVANNIMTITANQTNAYIYQTNINRIVGHKYLATVSAKLSTATTGVRALQILTGSSWSIVNTNNDTNWNTYTLFFTQGEAESITDNFRICQDTRASDWDAIQVKNVMLFDLTDMFGAGNEPTTYGQFKARFNKDYYDYTLPTLHHSPVTSIVSNETLNIPAQVQLLNGYGMGVNADCYNYIDFESKKFKQIVGFAKAKDLNWNKDTDGDNWAFYTTGISNIKLPIDAYHKSNLLSIYKNVIAQDNITYSNDKVIFVKQNRQVFIVDKTYSNTTDFVNHFTDNDYILFELETPIETDISEYITQDTLDVINTITFENEYEQAVPSEINYLIEV